MVCSADECSASSAADVVAEADGPDLYGSASAGAWRVGHQADGFCHIGRVDDAEPGQRPAREADGHRAGPWAAVPGLDDRDAVFNGGDQVATLPQDGVLLEQILLLLSGQHLPVGFTAVGEAKELHDAF